MLFQTCRPSFVFGTQIKIFLMKSESFLTLYRQQRSYYGQGTERKPGLEKKKKKSKSVHSEQNRYFNVSVPAFLCIITVPKPVRVEKITVNNVISFKIVFAYDDIIIIIISTEFSLHKKKTGRDGILTCCV